MNEVLAVHLASPFESRSAHHEVSEEEGRRSSRVKNASLLVFVVRGVLQVEFSQSALEMSSNEALLVPRRHSLELTYRYGCGVEWYALEFRATTPRANAPAKEPSHSDLVSVARPERVTDLLRRYLAEHNRDDSSPAVLSCILQLVQTELTHLYDQTGDSQCGQGVFEVIASRVDAFVAAHYREPIGTFEIARALRYNPDYLERVYRQECSMSIREAIQLRRIREAGAQLLLHENRSVSEIALMCGFNDTSFFRRAFKKATNMTPHRYRSVRGGAYDLTDALRHRGTSNANHRSRGRSRKTPYPSTVGPQTAVVNPIDALNGGFFVSPGFGTHARRVLDSYELIFVTNGCLELYEGDTTYRLRKNDALILFPGRRHGGLRPFEPELTFYWVHFRFRDVAFGNGSVRVPKYTSVGDPEWLAELFCTFISDQESSVLSHDSASTLIALMLCTVGHGRGELAIAPHRRPAKRDGNSLATLVDEYIDRNFRRPISTSVIAKDMKFSPDYLERVYREYRDGPIVQALHQRRIRTAREYLRNGNSRNINEIALDCGYNDPGYFRRIFKRLTGLTPKQYRSMFVQTHINAH